MAKNHVVEFTILTRLCLVSTKGLNTWWDPGYTSYTISSDTKDWKLGFLSKISPVPPRSLATYISSLTKNAFAELLHD